MDGFSLFFKEDFGLEVFFEFYGVWFAGIVHEAFDFLFCGWTAKAVVEGETVYFVVYGQVFPGGVAFEK